MNSPAQNDDLNWGGQNRRRFPRAKYPCLVTIKNTTSEGDALLTHTENLGIGGLCVTLKQSVKMFSPVEIELDLLDLGNHIKCKGKVVWSLRRTASDPKKPLFYDIGIEFQNIKEEEVKRLDKVVKRLVKDQSQALL